MTEDPYADLARLAREATPGPWETWRTFSVGHRFAESDEPTVMADVRPTNGTENAAYIAAASPDVILALLEERRVLRSFAEKVAASPKDTAGTRAAARYALTGSLDGVVDEMLAALSGAAQEQGEVTG
jgi:hypothetical protein